MTATAAEAAMVARWTENDAALAVVKNARAEDSRMAYLYGLTNSLLRSSPASFVDVVANATSPRAARFNRAKKLWLARSHQMTKRHASPRDINPVDFGPSIRRLLRDAAMWRMMEKSRAETEAMRAEFDRIERIA